MSAHTPGPWFVQPGFLTVYNMSGGDTCAVASVLKDQPGREAAEANARLIAAAPDLLNALTGLASAASSRGIPVDAARAAIAKATGGTP